ncbi:MAG: TldD/PmbA family protein [Gemmatimonadaceae bacterium]|jgi:predicted Zn-dependent protease|nr:TldD/PmbA family protein [Gemmatimonadaceae bacterium]
MTRLKRLGADGAAAGALLSRQEMFDVIARCVKLSKADEIEINVNTSATGNTRFAANQLSTSGASSDVQVVVYSAFGPKHAVVTTNDLSDESLERAVRQSEAIAKLSPDDPEIMPRLGAQTHASVGAYFDSTANLTAADRAQAAMSALGPARDAKDLQAAGFLITQAGAQAIGNSAGLQAYHRSSSANYQLTVRTADGTGSGWAAADDHDWSKVDFAAVSRRAIEKARLSRNPVAIEPGRYTVILEPQAAGDLVQLLAFYADARATDEGRSPFTKQGGGSKLGEKIIDERLSIISDPLDGQLLAAPFDGDGLPLTPRRWIDKGVLNELQYSRFWAKKQNKPVTGGASCVKLVSSATQSMEQLIAGTTRGILVTRLWYLREVDPRTILYTGLTRDGTFLIENGKVTKSLRNFRFNESPLFMLNNLEGCTAPERLAGTEAGGDVAMPALKVRDFNFTSLSEAV